MRQRTIRDGFRRTANHPLYIREKINPALFSGGASSVTKDLGCSYCVVVPAGLPVTNNYKIAVPAANSIQTAYSISTSSYTELSGSYSITGGMLLSYTTNKPASYLVTDTSLRTDKQTSYKILSGSSIAASSSYNAASNKTLSIEAGYGIFVYSNQAPLDSVIFNGYWWEGSLNTVVFAGWFLTDPSTPAQSIERTSTGGSAPFEMAGYYPRKKKYGIQPIPDDEDAIITLLLLLMDEY